MAAGALPDEESLQCVEHASTCDECGRRLKAAAQIFEQELSPEDEQLINKLPSSIPHPQTSIKENSLNKDDKNRFLFQFWRPAVYAVSGLIVLGFIGWGSITVYEAHENRVAKDVLEAEYRQGRPTEYRVADVPYGRSRTQLGATDKRYVQISGNNPTYRAAAALLKLEPSSAIEILEKARNSGNISKSVLNDLVVSYAIEYSQTGSDKYLQVALQLASEVIQKYPTDSVAYFNRALIYESMDCSDCPQKARSDFQQVVRLDSDPNWVQEAKNKLR